MKTTTGLIRRIDELGRVVIPKEIRRSMRLKDGEEVEISLGSEELILKKYSRVSSLKSLCDNCANSLSKVLGAEVFITDTSKVVSSFKNIENENKNLTHRFIEFLQKRERAINKGEDCLSMFIGQEKVKEQLILPLVVNGDLYGSIVVQADEIKTQHEKATQTALYILVGQLEN